ncbi:hypothetical protein [Frateuria sp. YIM B11624]|uniref:hypothetical protein n=1 Tax=Frateuria sp. YIM B11624 TaxID=3143185 RepID=UPI003C796616
MAATELAALGQVDAGDLPPRLAALAQVIGLPATLRLVEARGGTRFYVPEQATTDHWLAPLIGPGALALLVQHYGREYLELDRAAAALRAARDRQIVADAREGASTATIALQCGLTQRQVFNILARANVGAPALDQPDLFERSR